MSKAFSFPPLALSKSSRAELESDLQALADTISARSKCDKEGGAAHKRRDALAEEIRELENSAAAHAAGAAARLPALREQLAILSRPNAQPKDNTDEIRAALAGLSGELAVILKTWFGEIEREWFADIQLLNGSQKCTHPGVLLGQFPGYQLLTQCLLHQPKDWLQVVDASLPRQAEHVSGIARAILDGRNPFAWIHSSPRPPE